MKRTAMPRSKPCRKNGNAMNGYVCLEHDRDWPCKRVKAKRRATSPRCQTQRCAKPARVQGWCNTHAMREADRLARAIVMERDGGCRYGESLPLHSCLGPLQWCHVHSRRYKAIRHHPWNAVILCAKAHARFTHAPLEWESWCRNEGIPWDELRIEALERGPSWSLSETLERLSG